MKLLVSWLCMKRLRMHRMKPYKTSFIMLNSLRIVFAKHRKKEKAEKALVSSALLSADALVT